MSPLPGLCKLSGASAQARVECAGGEAARVPVLLLLHSTASIALLLAPAETVAANSPTASASGASPLAAPGPAGEPAAARAVELPRGGVAPLERPAEGPAEPGPIDAPLGAGPGAAPTEEAVDPGLLRLVRVSLDIGMVWRSRVTEPMLSASVEVGRRRGLSGSFHTDLIVAPDRDFVGVLDVPIGAGVVARGWSKRRRLSGSVGLSAGVLVHRASTDIGLVHRVDPDFRVPLTFTWTPGKVGLSLGIVQGYSVRGRTYERRGIPVWSRIPYRFALVIGVHFDVGAGQAKPRRSDERRRTR